ncbi:protein of unknown function YigZ [Syntrophotalea carbinolica DSM 2380]|uniref:YigZ family protein n=1 Tax=Syntrophotalea carbinolica (strain DSM 2380 / NBRC 103641 / GraBd1) TaxID=338963 RepID=Q3A1N7_SYNC1|nr:YigZ family protein [Syntrophotalea carbinolica]ABA89720.1 protein of unknown function YigZ [Syntrophotalea carbinolica DSM 2380]
MTIPATFLIPTETIAVEQEVKRSRFTAVVGRAKGREEAHRFIAEAKTRWPGAQHYCWGFVAGDPAATMDLGMSDDGEPQGTAGRPILNILRHSGIGEVVAVVVRYFGGIHLGTGGLVRAYSGVVQKALEQVPLEAFVPSQTVQLLVPFADEDAVRRLVADKGFTLADIRYAQTVEMFVNLPSCRVSDFCTWVQDRCRGRIRIKATSQSDAAADHPDSIP